MFTAENIKRALALVVLACFFLPLSQCTAKMAATPNAQAQTKTEVFIPVEAIRLQSVEEVPFVAVFVWPLGFWALRRLVKARRLAVVGLELACGLASLTYLVLVFQFWGELRYGGVLVLLALLGHVLVSAFELTRHAIHHRRTPSAVGP